MYYLCKTNKNHFYLRIINLLKDSCHPDEGGNYLNSLDKFLGFNDSSLLRRDDKSKDNNIHSISLNRTNIHFIRGKRFKNIHRRT
jgi:hypothetical protein